MKLNRISLVAPINFRNRTRATEFDSRRNPDLSISLSWSPDLDVAVARIEEHGEHIDVPMTNIGSWTAAQQVSTAPTSQSLPEASTTPAGPELPTRSAGPTEGTQGAPRKKVGKKSNE
jgi:hypothetical protein